jgi:hypothetical protein
MFDRGENNPKKSSPARGWVFPPHQNERFRTALPQLSWEIRAALSNISKNFPENLSSIESRANHKERKKHKSGDAFVFANFAFSVVMERTGLSRHAR